MVSGATLGSTLIRCEDQRRAPPDHIHHPALGRSTSECRLSAPHSSKDFVNRGEDEEEVHGYINQQKRDYRVDKITNLELAAVDGEFDRRKSGLPMIAAINGVITSFTNAVTTAPNAAPITTATARSRTLQRNINRLKPCKIPPFAQSGRLTSAVILQGVQPT
jgi:hypothetical protein